MKADLHVHSVYSDGWYTPDQICSLAASRGIGILSITDHDTLNGETEKRQAAEKYGIRYLSGWEISAYEGREKVHILGYGCKIGEAYRSFNEKRKLAAFERAKDSVRKFRSVGVPVTFEEVLSLLAHADSPVHTMHVARAAAKHLGRSEGDVYQEYLAPGKLAHSTIGRPTPQEAIDCIHALGGFASIAHPGRWEKPFGEWENAIKTLKEQGADGIEAVYTTHTAKETEYFRSLASAYGLLLTGGSDTHVEDGTHAVGSPSFSPSEALLERFF